MAARFKARRDVIIAGNAHAAGKTFEADPDADAIRVAEARGLITRETEEAPKAKASKPSRRSKRSTKERDS
jgi:hypothetical protein